MSSGNSGWRLADSILNYEINLIKYTQLHTQAWTLVLCSSIHNRSSQRYSSDSFKKYFLELRHNKMSCKPRIDEGAWVTVGLKPREVFRVRIWSALKCSCCLENINTHKIKITLFGVLDLSFPDVRRGSYSYHIIRKLVQRSESLKELSVKMSRIVFLEVHWSLDRQLNRILLHRLWTIAKILMLGFCPYV